MAFNLPLDKTALLKATALDKNGNPTVAPNPITWEVDAAFGNITGVSDDGTTCHLSPVGLGAYQVKAHEIVPTAGGTTKEVIGVLDVTNVGGEVNSIQVDAALE